MPKIHFSTALSDLCDADLLPEKIADQFSTYSKELLNVAAMFQSMADTLSSKSIKIENVDGCVGSGCFEVDDIDAGRLKQAGLVEEFTNETPVDKPFPDKLFCIDSTLDTMLEKFQEIKEKIKDSVTSPEEGEKTLENFLLNNFETLPEEAEIEQGTQEVHLEQGEDPIVKVKPNGEGFDLNITDIGQAAPSSIRIYKKKGAFHFKCSSCEEKHIATCYEVRDSLKVVTALLTNLQHYAAKHGLEDIAMTLVPLEEDMRLLMHLIVKYFPQLNIEDSEDEPNE